MHEAHRRPGGRSRRARSRRPRGARARPSTVRVEGRPRTLLERTGDATSGAAVHQGRRSPHRATPQQRAAARSTPRPRGNWAAPGDGRAIPRRDDQGRAHSRRTRRPNYRRSGSTTSSRRRRCLRTRCRRATSVLLFPSGSATAARAPTPLRIRCGLPASAGRQGVRRARRAVRVAAAGPAAHRRRRRARRSAAGHVHRGRRRHAARDGPDSKGKAGVRATKPASCGLRPSGVRGRAARTDPPPGSPARRDDTVGPATTLAASRTARCSRARKAPRTLRGKVASDPSGLSAVKIRLLRKAGKKCSFFSGGRERFRKTHLCWHGAFFKIGDRADWSYLLPKRLGRGRYRLEAYGDRRRVEPRADQAHRVPGALMRRLVLVALAARARRPGSGRGGERAADGGRQDARAARGRAGAPEGAVGAGRRAALRGRAGDAAVGAGRARG